MILVDTSVWIDYFNGKSSWQTDFLDGMLVNSPVIMGDLILIEILQGFRKDKDYNTAKSCLSILPLYQMGGYNLAISSSENYRKLRKKGITVRKTMDVIIATFCIENNITLLHNDHDFEPMVKHLGLDVISK